MNRITDWIIGCVLAVGLLLNSVADVAAEIASEGEAAAKEAQP